MKSLWFRLFWRRVFDGPTYYTPSGRLCPYYGMSDDTLDDFEKWADSL